ncbi:hypothetical protein LBMAG42_03440 [Deltaproteobacteria bacterium]|nr:hypothetical protein LBMAG42_03440 [Deltaproteobacteria bacterium]
MFLLLATHALAECPRMFDTGDILEAANSAESAFAKADRAGFKDSTAALELRTSCAAEVLSVNAQARIHRVEALGAFLDQRLDRVPLALAGVFATEPGHQIPTALLPDGHPIRGQVTAAMLYLHDDLGAELPKPGSGWIEADGTHVLRAPSLRAAILQQLDGQGAVLATHYRWPDEVGFDWVVPVAESSVATANLSDARGTAERPPSGEWGHRAPWLVLSGASLITSGVLYALAAEGRADFDAQLALDGDVGDEERANYRAKLEGMATGTNGLSYGCYVAAGAGVAFGVVAAVTW